MSKGNDQVDRLINMVVEIFRPLQEVVDGIRSRRVPWLYCTSAAIAVGFLILFRIDVFLFKKVNLFFFIQKTTFSTLSIHCLWS